MITLKDEDKYGIFMAESPEIGPCQIEIESIGWGATRFSVYFYGEKFFGEEFDFDEKIPEDDENYYFEVPCPYYMDLTIRKPLGKRITEEELKELKNQENKDSIFKRSTLEKTTIYLGMWNAYRMGDVVIKEVNAVLVGNVYHLDLEGFSFGLPRLTKNNIGKVYSSKFGGPEFSLDDLRIHVFDTSRENLIKTISDFIQAKIDANQMAINDFKKAISGHQKDIDALAGIKARLNGESAGINVEERKKKLINPFITELSKCLEETQLNAIYTAFVCAFGEKQGDAFYKKNKGKIVKSLKEVWKASGCESLRIALNIICQMEGIKVPKEDIKRFIQLYRAYYVSSDYSARKNKAYIKALDDCFENKEISKKLETYVSFIVLLK